MNSNTIFSSWWCIFDYGKVYQVAESFSCCIFPREVFIGKLQFHSSVTPHLAQYLGAFQHAEIQIFFLCVLCSPLPLRLTGVYAVGIFAVFMYRKNYMIFVIGEVQRNTHCTWDSSCSCGIVIQMLSINGYPSN